MFSYFNYSQLRALLFLDTSYGLFFFLVKRFIENLNKKSALFCAIHNCFVTFSCWHCLDCISAEVDWFSQISFHSIRASISSDSRNYFIGLSWVLNQANSFSRASTFSGLEHALHRLVLHQTQANTSTTSNISPCIKKSVCFLYIYFNFYSKLKNCSNLFVNPISQVNQLKWLIIWMNLIVFIDVFFLFSYKLWILSIYRKFRVLDNGFVSDTRWKQYDSIIIEQMKRKNWVIYNMLYWSDGYRKIELGYHDRKWISTR